MGFDLIHETLGGASDLTDSPSLAVASAQASPDPLSAYGNAQTTSQTATYDATVQAIKKQAHHVSGNHWNVLADVAHLAQDPLGSLKTAGSDLLEALSKPLEQVQHEYRYLKDVSHTQSPAAAVWEGFRLVAGAGAGLAVAALAPEALPLYGAAVTGAGAATFLPHSGSNPLAGYKDSWDRSATADGSPGRDFARLIHFDPKISIAGHKAGLLSGTLDGLFDIAADPALAAGNELLAARQARYALRGPEDLARAYKYQNVQRAVQDVIDTNSPTALLRKYPSLGPRLATRLADAKTPEDVFQLYANHMTALEYMSWDVPRLSFIRGNAARPIKERLALLGINPTGAEQRAGDIISGEGVHGVDAEGNLVAPTAPDLQAAAGRSQTLQRGFERVYRRITTHLPLQYDARTGEQLTREIDPMSMDSVATIRDWAKYGNNAVVANSIADAYARAPVSLRLHIIRNLQIASAAKMGMAEHPEMFRNFIQNVNEDLERARGFYGVAPSPEVYARAMPYDDGFNITVPAAEGADFKQSAAIWSRQVGNIGIQDFREWRRAIDMADRLKSPGVIATTVARGDAEKAARLSLTPYRFDDFMYHYVTSNFKRLALSTGGFALRIGTGEALREILNQGWARYAQAKLAQSGTRYAMLIRNGEQASGFADRLAALHYAGAKKLFENPLFARKIGAANPLDFMIESQLRHDGPWLPSVIDGQHNALDMIESRPDRMAQLLGKTAQKTFGRRTGDWRMFDQDNHQFATMHRGAVEQIVNSTEGSAAAQAWRDALAAHPGDDAAAMQAAIAQHARYLEDNPQVTKALLRADPAILAANDGWEGFARTQIRALRGLTEGPSIDRATGALLPSGRNNDLIDAIAKKRLPSGEAFANYDKSMVPEMVHGQELENYSESRVDRLFNVFHRKVTAPILNSFSRRPTFALRGAQEYERLKPYIGTSAELKAGATREVQGFGAQRVQVPLISHDDAMDIAEHRAALSMLPDIHNPRLRTQFHQIMENYAPFLFAKQQAWQRWGRLAIKDPNMLRRLEILHSGMKNVGFIQKDEQTGQEYFAYPLSGYVGGGLVPLLNKLGFHTLDGVPLTFRGSMTSFKSIIPGTEEETGLGLGGPLFFTTMKSLESYAPETAPIVEKSLGQFSTNPIWTEILPNPLFRNLIYAYAGEHSRAFQSAEMFALQYYYSHHKALFDNPDPRIRNQALAKAKNLARVVYVLKAFLGESLPAAPQFQIGKPQFTSEFLGYLEKSHNWADALHKFQAAHKDIDVTPYTVFQSQGAGVNIPPSEEALKFFQQNRGLLSALPDGGAYLIPQSAKHDAPSQAIYNEQIALGMRHKKSPEQYLTDLYAAHGDALYYDKQRQIVEQRKDAAGNQFDLQQIDADWKAFKDQLSLMNPTWAEKHFGQDAGVKKDRAITELQALFRLGAAPKTEQSNLVAGVLREYADYKQQKEELSGYAQTRGIQAQSRQLDLDWQNRLQNIMNSEPRLIPLIQGLFYDKALADQQAA